MTFEEAKTKIESLASIHAGKFGSKANFSFEEGTVHLDDSISPSVILSEAKEASCTIKIKIDDLDKLIKGDLNVMMAFMTGKLKIEGDKAIAMKLTSLF